MTTLYTHWGYINCTYKAEGDSITFRAAKVDCEFCKVSRTFPHGHAEPDPKQIHHWCEGFDELRINNESFCGTFNAGDVLNPDAAFVNCPKCLAKHAKETKPDPEFTVGDVVRLKSGGPWMTVTEHDDGGIRCVWSHDGQPQHYTFRKTSLVVGDA